MIRGKAIAETIRMFQEETWTSARLRWGSISKVARAPR